MAKFADNTIKRNGFEAEEMKNQPHFFVEDYINSNLCCVRQSPDKNILRLAYDWWMKLTPKQKDKAIIEAWENH